MRNGILQSVMCLVGIQGPAACNGEINWKNAKVTEQSLCSKYTDSFIYRMFII